MMHKTRVTKVAGRWWVDYYMPYSGLLCADFDSWLEAIKEAWAVEEQKMWV